MATVYDGWDKRHNGIDYDTFRPKTIAENVITTDGKTVQTKIDTITTQDLESTGYGVVSGLKVLAQTIPNMTVNIISGIVHMPNGVRLAPTENCALAINTSDLIYPRKDIVYVKADSTIGYTAGIPSTSPLAPTTPTGAFLLSEINVGVNVTSITSDNIIDKRKMKITTEELRTELTSQKTEINNLKYYSTLKSQKDSNGIFTTIEIKRVDGTLYMRSVLSGGSTPNYTTRTETYYKTDGITVDFIKTYARTYDNENMLISEVIS